MDTIISFANLIAIVGAIGTAYLGLRTYRRQKEYDQEFELAEIKRSAVTGFLSSIEELVNHAAFSDSKGEFDQASAILKCKTSLNKVYIYAPKEVVASLDNSLSAAIALANIVSNIPNSEICDENRREEYQNESDQLDEMYAHSINIVRKEMGLFPESVERVQLLILGKHTKE